MDEDLDQIIGFLNRKEDTKEGAEGGTLGEIKRPESQI